MYPQSSIHAVTAVLIQPCSPGEPLPPFPPVTHCSRLDLASHPNLSPFPTVNDIIGRIPIGTAFHNPAQMVRVNKPPYSAHEPLRNAITCTGGLNYHPSGTRNFTTCELALLQGFPIYHKFGSVGTKKQIGNAFPPIVAKVFFDWIRRWLEKVDGVA